MKNFHNYKVVEQTLFVMTTCETPCPRPQGYYVTHCIDWGPSERRNVENIQRKKKISHYESSSLAHSSKLLGTCKTHLITYL